MPPHTTDLPSLATISPGRGARFESAEASAESAWKPDFDGPDKLIDKPIKDVGILYLGDPTLGEKGLRMVKARFPNVVSHIWNRGDNAHRDEIRADVDRLPRDTMEIILSFYGDLYVPPKHLKKSRMPVNIHPSLPSLPGMAYWAYPILDAHPEHGATLHIMNRSIDRGPILGAKRVPLSPNATYMSARVEAQGACLTLLSDFLHLLLGAGTLHEALRRVQAQIDSSGESWHPHEYKEQEVNARVRKFREECPDHRLFWDCDKQF